MSAYLQQITIKETIRPEIVAAITAAVTACMSSQASTWQITSIRPLANVSRRWVLKGRQELMTGFHTLERKCIAV